MISALVGDALKNEFAYDCFCGELSNIDDSYEHSEKIVTFVLDAVKEKILKDELILYPDIVRDIEAILNKQ